MKFFSYLFVFHFPFAKCISQNSLAHLRGSQLWLLLPEDPNTHLPRVNEARPMQVLGKKLFYCPAADQNLSWSRSPASILEVRAVGASTNTKGLLLHLHFPQAPFLQPEQLTISSVLKTIFYTGSHHRFKSEHSNGVRDLCGQRSHMPWLTEVYLTLNSVPIT